jgi:hypothetical protein
MAIDLNSVLTSVGSLLGSNAPGANGLATQIIQQAAIGAAATATVNALTHPDVVKAFLPIDPLGLANKVGPAAPAAPAASAPKVVSLSDLAKLGLTIPQAQAMGYTVE